MTRRLNYFLLALLLLIGAPAYWLLKDTSPYWVPAKQMDIVQLRRLAEAIPGQKPSRIEMELVAWRRVPGDLFAAGSGLKRRAIGVMAFRLEVPGKGPVMLETGTTQTLADQLGMDRFDAAAQHSVDSMLRQSSMILVTDEHGDHLGGLAALGATEGGLGVLSRVKLNPAQLPSSPTSAKLPWPSGVLLHAELSDTKPQAVAPGIVVIPTPSHSPGSQMIFVRLDDGQEFLFAGDIASMTVNWRELRPRSRFLSDFYAPEDRRAVISWLHVIAALKNSEPAIRILPSHDYDWYNDPVSRSGVTRLPGNTQDGPAPIAPVSGVPVPNRQVTDKPAGT